MASDPKLIKVCLTNKGDDTETPWAQDLGPAPASAPAGSRKVKLVNVPFMHAKPTWGDVIIVSPAADAFPTWDRDGVPWKQIATRLVDDGGRWAMIVDYAPRDLAPGDAFAALARACDAHKIVCEGAWAPRDAEPGRVYLAVQRELSAETVMAKLADANLPLVLFQIHPEPKRPRAQTQQGITPEAPRPPAPVAPPPVDTTVGVPPPRPPAKPAPAAAPPAASSVPAGTPAKPEPKAAKPAAAARPAATVPPGAAAKPTAAKPAAKTPAAKTPAAKADVPAGTSTKKPATKKPAAKAAKPAAKAKPGAKKPVAKKAPPKPVAKKPVAAKSAKKPAKKR